LRTREIRVSVSVGKESVDEHNDCMGHKIADKIALIPILRSGLGMTDGMLELLPQAAVHHIGRYHVPGVAPVQYFNRLPRTCAADIAFVVDPVIASAETVMAVIAILKKVRAVGGLAFGWVVESPRGSCGQCRRL
jgi:uracil phosphoribosyltransferase